MATTLEIDAVIDPADTRAWLVRGLCSTGAAQRDAGVAAAGAAGRSGRFVDTW